MSKKIILSLVCCLLAVPALADFITIVNPSFELPGGGGKHEGFPQPGWNATCNSLAGEETGWGPTDGAYTAYMEIGEQIFNLTDHAIQSDSTYILTFDMRDTWAGTNATIDLYYDNAGSRVKIKSLYVGTLPADMVNYTLKVEPADIPPAALGKKLGIQITHGTASASCTGGGGWLGLDNFKIERPLIGLISPADGATLVDRNADLKWTTTQTWPMNVYFGTNPDTTLDPKVVNNQSVTTYDPGVMAYDTKYYWRVEALEPNSAGPKPIVHTGPTWSFTTQPQSPVFTLHPASQTVDKGSKVVLTVDGLNITGYKWYKNDVEIAGETGQTLTIPDAQLDDEGYYHCVGSGFGTATSNKARLMVKRLVGWWKLDGAFNDSVADVEAGAPAHAGSIADPNFVAVGKDGGAYEFFGDKRAIVIADSGEYFNFYPQGMTASVWIKTTAGGWGGILSKQDRTGTTWYGWILDHNGTSMVGSFRGATPDMYNDSGVSGEWVLATYVWDPVKQAALLYVNGTNPVVRQVSVALTLTTLPLVFGAEMQNGQDSFTGQLDDVRIWNYALSPVQIALLYTDFNPGSEVCTVNPRWDLAGPTVDGNGDPIPDCRVNIHDFAVIAGQWLECNIVPTCLP